MNKRFHAAAVFLFCISCTFVGGANLQPFPRGWCENIREAQKYAADSGKEQLVIFTGCDWEQWSRKFSIETLQDLEFQEKLARDFVVTQIDLPEKPRERGQLNDREIQSYDLAKSLKLHVFPSIYLCTSTGIPYGMVEYESGGPKVTLEIIETKKRAYADIVRRISSQADTELAVAIDRWLGTLPEPLQSFHEDKMKIIIASDPGDKTGLWTKYKLRLLLPEARSFRYQGRLNEAEDRYLEVIQKVRPKDVVLQDACYELADVYFQRKDYDSLLDTLDQAIAASPKGPRISVLEEMIEVFTKQWVYTKWDAAKMREAGYDCERLHPSPSERRRIAEIADKARSIAPCSRRNQALINLIQQCGGVTEATEGE